MDESGNRIDRSSGRIRVIFDTDTNNELDDQHALAYLLFNGGAFDLEGVTVNATYNGGGIDEHYREAERILELSTLHPRIPLVKGATGSFEDIRDEVDGRDFDGFDAVDFIIKRAMAPSDRELELLAVGKLTNVALAYHKEPAIAANSRLVWLGSNYPDPGEYNQDNDEEAMNFLLDTDLPFEMVVVRYGKPSGTDAVRASLDEIRRRMPGLGPRTTKPVTGRHGEAFSTFGDYSLDLFEHADYHGGPLTRALYDMAAVAIVKNPTWAKSHRIPAPILRDGVWVERPRNPRTIDVREDFDKEAILTDFYRSMEKWVLVEPA
ncbi:MAG TPA: nucleoside hydrolase [Rhodothermia bacterium]|nr:nucleoside hydrolase [Rhodothermia bacterium]